MANIQQIKIGDSNPDKILFDTYSTSTDDEGIDVSSVECWDGYVGDTQVYHKDKTVYNCWIEYKLAEEVSKTNGLGVTTKIRVRDLTGIEGNKILPEVIDWQSYMLEYSESGYDDAYAISFNMSIVNTEFWNSLREWFATHWIPPLVLGEELDAGYGILKNSNFSGELTINLNSNYQKQYLSMSEPFGGTGITKLTINLAEGCQFTSLHHTFRNMRSLQEIVWGESNTICGANDISGMCEYCANLTTFPNIINYEKRGNFSTYPDGITKCAWAFDNCNSITSIAQYGENREADDNTLISDSYQQTFAGCNALTTIGPIIDCRYVNKSGTTTTYWMFINSGNITDIRLKNLNHSDWKLDGGNIGNLNKLNAESIQYLFANLYDLTTKDTAIPKATYSCFTDWLGNTSENINAGGNYKTFKDIYFYNATKSTENAESPCYISEAIENEFQVNVTGLTDNITLIFGSGTLSEDDQVLTNGINTIQKTDTITKGFKLYNNEDSDISLSIPVVVSIVNYYKQETPENNHANLYCPSTWDEHITSDMIQAANNKGWTIFIGGVQVDPDPTI